nr:hypothetical protein [Tanacetum cinerariifolium]
VEEPKKKRVTEETLLQESFKKLKEVEVSGSETTQEVPSNDPKEMSEEDVQKTLEIIPVFEFKVQALQVKYSIIDWEIHIKGSKTYWKIIRVGEITEAYQNFEDMLKGFDREDLTLIKMKAKKAKLFDEQTAQKLHEKEVKKATAREKQEKDDMERAQVLQKQYDDKEENIDWNTVAEQIQERHLDNIRKYQKIIPVSEFKVEALQVKYSIIDWEIHIEGSKTYWKIIRVGEITEAYQNFEDMLKVKGDVVQRQRKSTKGLMLLVQCYCCCAEFKCAFPVNDNRLGCAKLEHSYIDEYSMVEAHVDYLKHTQEHADTLRKIVEQARALKPLDSESYYASSTKNLVPIPRESKVTSDNGNKSTEPVKDDSLVFTTISNPLFKNDEINSNELNLHIESTSNHDTVKFDNLDEFSGPFIPIHIVDEERIMREHAEYINRMEMCLQSTHEEIDVITKTDDVLPPSVENDDSDGEVDAVDDLRVDNSILNFEHESSESEDSDFDNPNTIVMFEFDARVKFDVSNENDDYSYFMFVKVFSLLSAESEDTIFDPGPELQPMTPGTINYGIMQNPSSSTPYVPPRKKIRISYSTNSPVLYQGVKEQLQPVQFDNDPFHEILTSKESSQESSSNVQPSNPPFEHLNRWIKDHPLDNAIGNPSRPVSIRCQLITDAM